MIKEIKLDSGVKLLLDYMDSVKSVSVGIWCGAGSQNEKPEENGISHFIEHMLFKGTSNRNAYQIVKEIDALGAEINAFTSKQRTCFYVKCISEHIFDCCDVLVDMVEHPVFDQKELEREKLVIIEEINMNADDPDDVAIEEFDSIIFDGSNLSRPVLGSKENVTGFNHDDLEKYYREHYTKDNLVVSVAGNFDENSVVSYFKNAFSNLGESCRKDDFGKPIGKTERKTINKDIEQAHIVLGLKTIAAGDDRRYHMSILSTILGGGMSSRLFQNVREKKGLAYSVFSSNSFYTTTGEFAVLAGVAMDRVDEAIEAIKEEIENLGRERISEDEFTTAKEQLKSSYIFSMEAPQSRMRINGNDYFVYGRCREQEEALAIIDNITLDDIEKTKAIISDFSNYSIVNVTGKANA